jgi:predicted nucleic acid-binding protein
LGRLSLPQNGRIYLDANAIIYSVEKIEPFWELLRPLWLTAQRGEAVLFGSELLLLETLVKPFQIGDDELTDTFRNLLYSQEMNLLPITRDIIEDAARIRAKMGLKTPDAIHAATALITGCDLFLTNDSGFKRVRGLPTMILAEVVAK